MRAAPLLLFLLHSLASVSVHADGLGDLRQTLGKLTGGAPAPVRARVEYQLWREVSEDKIPVASQAKATLRLEAGPDGLRLHFPASALKAAAKEAVRQVSEPDAPAATRATLRAIEPDEVNDLLDFAPALLAYVDFMQLVGDQQDSYDGQPARLLAVKIAPRLPKGIQKYLKSFDSDARIWLGSDGTPVGFRNNLTFRGSRMLISFDGFFKDERTLRRVGDRLVVVRHVHEESFATLGQRNQSRRLTTVTVD